MANVCRVGSKTLDFTREFYSLVKSLEVLDKAEIKQKYLEELKRLKLKYSSDISEDDFFNFVRDIIDNSDDILDIIENNENLSEVLSQNYNGELSIYDPNFVESTLDNESKFDKIDSTPQENNDANALKESTIAQYFPMASDARLAFELKFKNGLIKSLFFNDIDSDNPRINISNVDMDNSIKQYRKNLASYLDSYILKYIPENYRGFKQKTIENKLSFFKNLIDSPRFSISSMDLIKIPVIDTLPEGILKDKLLAYIAYIALSNFDDLVSTSFGDSVDIRYKNNYKTSEIKYRINLGNRSATGWSDQNEDVDETEEIGGIIRLFMESLDMYSIDNGEVLPYKMSFSDVKSGLGGIMNLFSDTNETGLTRNIKLHTYLLNLKDNLEKTGIQNFYGKGWDDVYDTYIRNNTLGQLIALTKLKPSLLMPLLFTVLATNYNLFFNNRRYLEKQAVYSLWQNLFNYGNSSSLIRRTMNSGGINIDNLDLYSFVATLFVNIENIPVIEYRKDDDKISVIGLKQNTASSKLNAQKYTWAANYNAEHPQQFKSFTIDDFPKDSNATNIRITKTDILLNISTSGDNVAVVPKLSNGKNINLSTLTPELQEFLSEVLNEKIDNDYYKLFTSLGGTLKDLLDIAGTILYNYKVGKTLRKLIDNNKRLGESERKIYDDNLKTYYPEKAPDMMRGAMLPELITKSIFPKVRTFSLALDIQQGYSGDTTAKDGQGKQISLLGLSSLDSKYLELFYNHNLGNPNSILKGFNIYDSFELVEFVRDYSGNDNKKLATTFSEAEFFEANFLYDFYGEQVSVSDTGAYSDLRKTTETKGTTKFRIMGPIVSDKPKLPKLRFDWRSIVDLPDGTLKRYLDLTSDDIYQIQLKEFGDYYKAVYARIHLDWDNIQPYIQEIFDQNFGKDNSPVIIIDYDQDFELFRNICKQSNIDPEEVVHQALVNAQREARISGKNDVSIKIIKGIHYLKGFHNNPALFHQLSIYGNPVPFKVSKDMLPNMDTSTILETPEQSRERINLLFISELLQNNIELRIGDNDATAWAAELFNKDGVWRNDKNIILAKIYDVDNFVLNISSLRDFLNWKEYLKLTSFYDILPEKFNISNPKFELSSTLQAINILKKYNLFKFSNALDVLLKDYLEKGLKESINKIVEEELRKNNPKWGDEAIQRHVLKEVSSMSEEDIKIKKAKYKLNKDINQTIKSEIEGKPSKVFSYKKHFKTISDYLESLPEYTEDNIKLAEKNVKELNEKLKQTKDLEEKEKIKKALSEVKNQINVYKMRERIQGIEFNIRLNPEIERYHALNNWLGESFLLTTVGTFIAHPGDNNASTIWNYEYRMFGLQVKRNVSHTATKHREVLNSLKGIRNKIRIAIMTDAEDSYITFKGDYGTNVETHNGATFYNGTMVSLDNNSLGADAMGLDKKPFIHAIDPETGIGIIIKTAGFAVANSYILKSPEAFGRINRKMNDAIKWTETLRKYGYTNSYFDWLHDFNGNRLSFVSNSENGWYVQRNGRFYKFYNPNIDSNGNTRIRVLEVYNNGQPLNKSPYIVRFGYVGNEFIPVVETSEGMKTLEGKKVGDMVFKPINSNWELWNVFGGAYSCHFDDNHKLTSVNDENSFKMVNYVMNHTGKVINEDLPKWDQSNVIQIVKHSQIDMMPTTEAVKFGPANINDVKKVFSDDSYTLTYMEVFSDDMGELLDAEHTAEGGHVSLMTLVINALGARGYSTIEAEECYHALELLAEQSFEEAFDNLLQQNNSSEAKEAFKTAIANIMLQTLKNTSISDGNILSAIALGLKRFLKFGDYSQLEGSFPISSPQIYANLFSKLASTLEKASVRLKFDGGMLVLNPSNGIYQIIDGKLLGNISKNDVTKLQVNSWNKPLTTASQIQFGRNYYIINGEGNYTPKLVDNLNDFYELKNEISKEGVYVIEAFYDVLEVGRNEETGELKINNLNDFKPIGRDLATYGCIIKESNSDRTFSLWETDVVKLMFSWNKKTGRFDLTKNPNVVPTALEVLWNRYHSGLTEINEDLLKDFSRFTTPELLTQLSQFSTVEEALLYELNKLGIKEINPNRMHLLLERAFLDTLNSISNGIRKNVIINGEEIKIDKSGTFVSPYEAILPMIYKTTFGLKEGDEVGTIELDKYFFVKRFIENSKSKFYSQANGEYTVNGDEFDLELKKTSGNHIYIAHSSRDLSINEPIKIQSEVFDGVLYRMIDGKKAYPIPSKINKKTGQLVENCKFYKAFNGVEIIQTDDIKTILDSESYNSISFGDFSETSDKDLLSIFEQIEQSSNKVAKNKAQYIINAVTGKVKTNKEGIQKGNRLYTDAIRDELLRNEYLNSPGKFNSIAEIFGNLASLNALHNHELYTKDASNQQNLLIELLASLNDPKLLKKFLEEHPHMLSILDFGLKQHTSFLTSLEAVVSRTPAQSHLSFMAMKVVGFDSNITNSIYVSRMQLYLQGSDFDIDKANVLGLKYNNGILYVWSPYFDLSSKEKEIESESLPFPSGKSLLINDSTEKIPWNVIDKNYLKVETEDGEAFIDNNGNIIKVHFVDKNTYSLEFIPNQENLNTNTYLLLHAVIKNFGKGIIISNGVLNEDVFNIDETGKYLGLNVINDYNLYLQSLDLSEIVDEEGRRFSNIKDLGKLIRTFTSLREIPSNFLDYINIVNRHNTMFLKKDGTKDKRKDKMKRNALYNFISIKTKNISKDPINLIQGLSGIDVATDEIKDLVKPGRKFDRLSSIPTTSNHESILARMHLLVLTLTGKLNVGIVASAMKVFEAMSHYYYKILANGTIEELERLLSNIKIMGKRCALIANSFVKNPDTILSDKVFKAYLEVNNFLDAFIMMSALLSLATDNAKDPTLSKLNATPQTLGCYTAGLVLGLTVEEVADLLISDTGLLLTRMLQGNVFSPSNNQFKNLSGAISFIRNIPEIPKNVDLSEYYEMFGIKTKEDDKNLIDEDLPGNGLRSPKGRKKFKRMAMFILKSDKFEFETDQNKLARKTLKEIQNDPLYWGWNLDSEEKLKNSKGKKKEKLEKLFKEHQKLVELGKSYEAYLDNPESSKAYEAKKDLKEQIELIEKLSSKSNKEKLKALRNSTLEIKEALQSVFEWIEYREIVENDKISNENGEFSRLEQIRKLNSFNEEMGDLRTVLKLNQGLPNSVQDQLSWINNFKGILSRAARRQNRKIKDDSDTPLATFNNKYGSLDLDLNRFLNDIEYLLDAIRAYESTKVGVNILDVMLNVPHYTGYMKTMNLLYEGGKAVSKNYDTLASLVKDILPLLSLKSPEQNDLFFKTLNPVIFERVNNNFLWQQQEEYEIPKFKIINGELKEYRDEKGNLLYETIRLGTKLTNDKFKDYCVHYIYPYLKSNYPNNAFVKAISLRTYGYNLDHSVTRNIAKKSSYNLTNPKSNALFNEVKKALGELNGIRGLIKALYYYNLIAYNNLPGAQALTDLFEDFMVYNTNDIISKYTEYITYLDESDIKLFGESDNDYLLRVFAPKIYPTDDITGLKYFWITNPENNKDILIEVTGEPSEEELRENPDNDSPDNDLSMWIDDNDYNSYSKYKSYKTMEEVLKQLNAKVKSSKRIVKEADTFTRNSSANSKRFILGKEILNNSEQLSNIISLEYKKKTWSELDDNKKNEILKKHSKDISLSIGGKIISLLDTIKLAESNGWTEQNVLDGFEFVSRKSKNHKYDTLVFSTLKTALDLITKPKDC